MCSSLLFKGVQLEPALGSTRFALLVGELWLSGAVMYCGLNWGAYKMLGHRNAAVVGSYRRTVLVGFSGMLPSTVLQCSAAVHLIKTVTYLHVQYVVQHGAYASPRAALRSLGAEAAARPRICMSKLVSPFPRPKV
jgi:hypothetical protein